MKKLILFSGILICILSSFSNLYGQSAIIKGRVIDSLSLETLMSVNIVETGGSLPEQFPISMETMYLR